MRSLDVDRGIALYPSFTYRVCACVNAACGYDAEEEDRVPDVVERVDADAVAALQTYRAEAGGELPDCFEGAAGGDVV